MIRPSFFQFLLNAACTSVLLLSAHFVMAQPPNDDPINALNISPIPGGSCGSTCGAPGFYADAAPGACTNLQGGANCTVAAAGSFAIMAPPCGNYNGGDVWFKFTVGAGAGQQSFRLTLSPGGLGTPMTDGAMAAYLYDGVTPVTSPSAFSFVGCSDNGNTNMPVLALSCLTASKTYYVRVWAEGNLLVNGQTFKLCFMRSNNNAPSNDDPCGAVNLPVNPACVNATTPAGVIPWSAGPRNQYACATGAPPSANLMPDPSCAIPTGTGPNVYRGGDVWFKVQVPANGAFTVTSSTSANTPSLSTMCMAAYTAGNSGTDCSTYTGFNELTCNNGANGAVMPSITLKCLTPGDIIYIRCYAIYNSAIGYFNICATSTADPVPQSNDNPCGAINVLMNSCLNTATETNAAACFTLGVPDPNCTTAATFTSGTTKDVWYRFTAPANGIAIVDVNGGTVFKPGLAVYQTPSLCSDPLSLIACSTGFASGNFNASVPLSGLTAGGTYYVRVWGTATNGTGSNTAGTPFTICVNTAAGPSSGNCFYLLQMIDTGSGAALGWGPGAAACSSLSGCASAPSIGTSYVDINVNGTHTFFSNPDENTYGLFEVPTAGPTLQATYNTNGNVSAAQQFRLLVLGGGQVHPASAGTFTQANFSALNFCTVPPQPQQDCIGAQTICSSTTLFLPAVTGTGNVADLNGSNAGCLSTFERGGGRWFFFRTNTNTGSVQMTITPNGPFDIDFAIWRPLPVGAPTLPASNFALHYCPPLGQPVRCSFAANGGGLGGLISSAAENTEGVVNADGFVHSLDGGVDYGTNQAFIMYINNFGNGAAANQNYTVSWNVSPANLLDCTILPMELIDITAQMSGSAVDVAWSTASERNSAVFVVERSSDNERFTPIGEVPAMGESQDQVDYAFRDEQPVQGANYYRVQLVDRDGSAVPSNSAVVLVGDHNDRPVLFPNPVNEDLFIAMRSVQEGNVVLIALDALGRKVGRQPVVVRPGLHTLVYPAGGLMSGPYILQALMPDGSVLPLGAFIKH